jgi:hypothetical protein
MVKTYVWFSGCKGVRDNFDIISRTLLLKGYLPPKLAKRAYYHNQIHSHSPFWPCKQAIIINQAYILVVTHQQEDVVIVNISRNKLNMGSRHFSVLTCYCPHPRKQSNNTSPELIEAEQ